MLAICNLTQKILLSVFCIVNFQFFEACFDSASEVQIYFFGLWPFLQVTYPSSSLRAITVHQASDGGEWSTGPQWTKSSISNPFFLFFLINGDYSQYVLYWSIGRVLMCVESLPTLRSFLYVLFFSLSGPFHKWREPSFWLSDLHHFFCVCISVTCVL